jgi:hypothetical protein
MKRKPGCKVKGPKSSVAKNDPIHHTPVAHPCNPSYLEGRNQEDHSLNTALANRPYLENTQNKKKDWQSS